MATGGALKKVIIDGLNFPVSSDNDANFTIGGRYVTEMQDTTADPMALVDKIAGSLKGVELRAVPGSTEFDNADAVLKKSANQAVTCLVTFASGRTYTAKGGAKIVVSGAADGMATTREGKLVVDINPVKGSWSKS